MSRVWPLPPTVLASVLAVPVVLWFIVFGWAPAPFWDLMAPAMAVLLGLAWLLGGRYFRSQSFGAADVAWGVVSAAALWGVFWVGNAVAPLVIPGAHQDIGNVYGLKAGFSPWAVGAALVFLFGPAEASFWQGVVQSAWAKRFGPVMGWLLTAAFYAAIHSFSRNPMLVLAALVAGLGWGYLYRLTGRLWAVMISHSLWDLAVLVLFPIH
ncbi:MAG: CPBP family intramembrane metalloprotease [Firmicutes bacterium]|nr:CPBP family intramembrane metalloprotease [Alicyclobacillaceae bacterium]MCL6497186.1 CPBP family intramembrane metalloprotease [Bacillota bacterium]